MGSGVILHKKVGRTLREGDVLYTLFAEVGGRPETAAGPRRVITSEDVDAACRRLFKAFKFAPASASEAAARRANSLMRCFVERDGSVKQL